MLRQQTTGLRRGDKVIAYGQYKAVVISDRLAFNAFEVKTEPILKRPTHKRRQRVVMTVAESNLEKQ